MRTCSAGSGVIFSGEGDAGLDIYFYGTSSRTRHYPPSMIPRPRSLHPRHYALLVSGWLTSLRYTCHCSKRADSETEWSECPLEFLEEKSGHRSSRGKSPPIGCVAGVLGRGGHPDLRGVEMDDHCQAWPTLPAMSVREMRMNGGIVRESAWLCSIIVGKSCHLDKSRGGV